MSVPAAPPPAAVAPPPAAVAAPSAKAAAPKPKPRPRRWIDTLNVLLVCAALGLVIFSASPAILRAAGVTGSSRELDLHPAGRFSLPGPPSESPAFRDPEHGFTFAPADEDEDDPNSTEFEHQRRRDREIFQGHGDPLASPDRPAPRVHDPSPGAGDSRARFGVVRRKITLVEKPGEGGRVVGEIHSGETVMLIKETGDFALVAYSGEDGVLMGWAKKSEIAVR